LNKEELKNKFDEYFKLTYANDGAEGYEKFIGLQPLNILVFENFKIINELTLIKKIQDQHSFVFSTKFGSKMHLKNEFKLYFFTKNKEPFTEYELLDFIEISSDL
jgi:hypothetical protein